MASYTHTSTFTRTHARYLTSKVAADLKQMQVFYGDPSDQLIQNYCNELVELLVNDYLESVDYGYRKNGDWVIALSYSVKGGLLMSSDDRSGRVHAHANVTDCKWGSFLRKSSKFCKLSPEQRTQVEKSLPIDRTPGSEPGTSNGYWHIDKTYSTNGVSFERKTFKSK